MASEFITSSARREGFITGLLRERYERECSAFHKLGWDSNNFVYRVQLVPVPIEGTPAKLIDKLLPPQQQQAGTTALPSSANEVVARVSNVEAILNEDVRVENEVAAMCLVRNALGSLDMMLVPDVFAWGRPTSETPGWIIQEFKAGIQLDKAFGNMDPETRQNMQKQIARVFKLIQDCPLPASIYNLTAILDFDLSHIASPAEEYFYSLTNLGSMLGGSFDDNPDEILLRKCLLEGFDKVDNTSGGGEGGEINWIAARITDHEFIRAGVLRPSEIKGCGELANLKWFLESLSPPYFYMPRWVQGHKQEFIDKKKQAIRSTIEKYLDHWGF
ncbi:hypothetical protein GGS20DRAFT_592564 [Poronia punctata]|nr:hypothetical protein GGS20DRAFT_592564 [Poronia punctata]